MNEKARTETDALNWVFLFLTLLLAGIHLYLGVFAPFVPVDRAIQFVVITLALLVGPVLYFTPYWRPVLYLLGVGFAAYFGAIWFFGGMEYFRLGVLTGVTATGFAVLGLYLFFREETGGAAA